ncbi:hypothetical protein [Sulfitobacter delicatus]|uniref:Uncharacterized protein n=1 Tax=Sulfitobacter delicatus TaxID=218672 RepID=A0A1G7HNX4_9RHOB|nr:hypothetical protein [Sulfitobacter delicatus]SDF02125.1 hypothetical protein SAMN04489759_101178 [Sulfitobacter delicatus]
MKDVIVAGLARIANYKWNRKEKVWSRAAVSGTSLGAAGAMVALGKIFGISAVAHSSGAMILTGSAGYISGTFLASALVWFVWPLLIAIGLIALFWGKIVKMFDWAVRRLYFARNDK